MAFRPLRRVNGVVRPTPSYHGQHRQFELEHGIGFIPLGDRNRDIGSGEGILEERESLDKYSKYINRGTNLSY